MKLTFQTGGYLMTALVVYSIVHAISNQGSDYLMTDLCLDSIVLVTPSTMINPFDGILVNFI